MAVSSKPARPAFKLEDWYSAEAAKAKIGRLCQAINENGATVGLLGKADRPLLLLVDADTVEAADDEIEITIDKLRAEWSAVLNAALYLGTVFRVHGKKVQRVVLKAHPKNRPSAWRFKSKRPTGHLGEITRKLEEVLDELKGISELRALAQQLTHSINVFERTYRDVWRHSQGLPPMLPNAH